MQRREFLLRTAKTLLVLPFGTFLVHCAGDDDEVTISTTPTEPTQPAEEDPPDAPPRVAGGNVIYTSSNVNLHSHTFAVAQSLVISPPSGGISGNTSEAQLHVHTLVITEEQLRQAAALQTVKVRTGDTLGHTHVFTIVKVA